jgi:glycosyltransferase involved in cell wall biosynthesis
MIGRFEEKNGKFFTDKKNINAITRYLKYFEVIHIVARRTHNQTSIYPREEVNFLNGRILISLFDEMKSFRDSFSYLSRFKNVLEKCIISCDIVLNWSEPKSNIVVKIAKKYSKKIILYVGGCNRDILLSKKSIFGKLVAWPIYLSNKKAIYNSNYVHYVTKNELQKRYPTTGKVLSASYVNINLDNDESRLDIKKSKILSQNHKIIVGLIGYLNEVKGIDTAIKCLKYLDDKYVLKILGGGSSDKYSILTKSLKLQDRVFFEGTLDPGIKVMRWIDDLDIYIQPSRTEGLPRATIEAMSRGCPIITSNVIGLKELVNEKWSHKPGDWRTLSILIKELSNSVNYYQEESKRSIQVSNLYQKNILELRVDNFYKLILKELQ